MLWATGLRDRRTVNLESKGPERLYKKHTLITGSYPHTATFIQSAISHMHSQNTQGHIHIAFTCGFTHSAITQGHTHIMGPLIHLLITHTYQSHTHICAPSQPSHASNAHASHSPIQSSHIHHTFTHEFTHTLSHLSLSHTHTLHTTLESSTDPPVGGAAPPVQRAKAQSGGSWGPHLKALAPNITAKFYPHCVAI